MFTYLFTSLSKLKYNKRCIEHKSINNKFRKTPKAVHRSMKGNNINATEISTTEDIKSNFHKKNQTSIKRQNGLKIWRKIIVRNLLVNSL